MAESKDAAGQKGQPYRCFLIRCRLEEATGADGEPAWRFTVEQTGLGAARHSFSRLRDVEAFLEAELASVTQASAPGNSIPGQTAREQNVV